MLLSMGNAENQTAGNAPAADGQANQNVAEFMDNAFVGELVKDLGLDLGDDANLNDIIGKKDEEKKDEEKKDGNDKK